MTRTHVQRQRIVLCTTFWYEPVLHLNTDKSLDGVPRTPETPIYVDLLLFRHSVSSFVRNREKLKSNNPKPLPLNTEDGLY